MTLEILNPLFGEGGSHVNDQARRVLQELQGQTVSVFAGASAGTKMNVAALRVGDTLLSAVVWTNAGGALADDVANMTIQETHATGVITVSGAPLDAETMVVGATYSDQSGSHVGKTYTFKTTPASQGDIKISADTTVMAEAIAAAINSWENRKNGDSTAQNGGFHNPDLVATAPTRATGLVTVHQFPAKTVKANDTLQIGSATYTFKAVAGSATEVTIGATALDTINNLLAKVNANSTDVVLYNPTVYAAGSNVGNLYSAYVSVKAVAGGTGGNSKALVASVTDTGAIEVSASTLLGGLGTAGVVNLRAVADATDGTELKLTESATNIAVTASSSHFVAGTATGGVKSSTNLSSKSVVLTWYNKYGYGNTSFPTGQEPTLYQP